MAKLKKDGTLIEGFYGLSAIGELTKERAFQKEKDLVNFIESHIVETTELLGEEYLSHKREWRFGVPGSILGRWIAYPRIDLVIETRSGKRIGVECKNPTQVFTEISKVVSQLLSYIVLAEKANMSFDRTILLTTRIDGSFIEVVKRFNLPIEILVIGRDFGALWINGKTKENT